MKPTHKVIAIYNQKGGVGKTTITWALSGLLREQGYKVLCIDLDSQKNLSYTLNALDTEKNILTALTEKKAKENIYHVKTWGDIIPGSANMDALTIKARKTKQEYLLRELLSEVSGYDFILLDCSPGLGLENVNALTAADYLLVPSNLETYALQGISSLIEVVRTVKAKSNKRLTWLGIVITDYKPRLNLSQHLETQLGKMLAKDNIPILNTHIRYSVKVKEAILNGEPLPECNSSQDYKALCCEILETMKI